MRQMTATMVVVALLLGLISTRDVLASAFSPPAAVGNVAGIDAAVTAGAVGASYQRVAAGDNGTWIVVWMDTETPGSANPGFEEAVFARSVDGGRTWSGPQYVYPASAARHRGLPFVETDGSGRWVIAWVDGFIGVFGTTSVDDGVSWSAPVQLSAVLPFATDGSPTIRADRHGTWVVAWDHDPGSPFDKEIKFVRSTDNASTWSAEQVLNPDAGTDPYKDQDVDLATDRNGNWVAVWVRGNVSVAARSVDNGVTWSAPVLIGSGFVEPNVETDRAGRWVVGWVDWSPAKLAYSAYSDDIGATWSPPFAVVSAPQDAGTFNQISSSLAYLEHDHWVIALHSFATSFGGTIGNDGDNEVVESFDGGQTWDPPSLLNLNGRKDSATAADGATRFAVDGLGRTVMVWNSMDDLGGTIGTDADILFAVAEPGCPVLPRVDCATASPEGAHLSIKNGPGGKDRMKWRWRGGSAVTAESLGDPVSSSSYALCVYASVAGAMHAVMEARAEGGAFCNGVSCWAASGNGYAYKDSQLTRGALRQLTVSPGSEGRAAMQASLSGPATGPPSLPVSLVSPVRAQLINLETTTCWSASFSGATLNDGSRFVATSD